MPQLNGWRPGTVGWVVVDPGLAGVPQADDAPTAEGLRGHRVRRRG